MKHNGTAFDITFPKTKELLVDYELMQEIEIKPSQIAEFKIAKHKEYIEQWVKGKNVAAEEVWKAREECILLLCRSSV